MNIESLIEPFREIRDRGELDAEFIRDHRFRLAQGELDADFRLRRRGAAFPQHARRMGNGVFVEVDRHRDETGFRIPGGVRRKRARRHEPFGFEGENAVSGRNSHARRRVGGAIRGAGDLPEKLQNRRGQAVADRNVALRKLTGSPKRILRRCSRPGV